MARESRDEALLLLRRSLHRHADECSSRSVSDGAAAAFASAPARRPATEQQPGGWAAAINKTAGGRGSRSCRNAASPVKFALFPQYGQCSSALPRAASDGALSLRCPAAATHNVDSDSSCGTAVRSTRTSLDGGSPVKSSGGSARAHSHGSLLSFCAGQRAMSGATSGRPSHDDGAASDVSEQSERGPSSSFAALPAPPCGPAPRAADIFGPAGRASSSRVPSPFVPGRHVHMRDAKSLDEHRMDEHRNDELETGLRTRVEEARDVSDDSRAAGRQLATDLCWQSSESLCNAAAASAQRRSLDSGRHEDGVAASGPAAGHAGGPSAPRPCIPSVASVSAFANHRSAAAADASGDHSAPHVRARTAAMRRSLSHQLSGNIGFPGSPIDSAPSDDDCGFGSPSGGCPPPQTFYPNATHERRLGPQKWNSMSPGQAAVQLFWRLNHARQTVDFVRRQIARFSKLDRAAMSVMEALSKLNTLREYESALLSEGSPAQGAELDSDMPLLEQAFQTAEACRLAHPGQDWLHLVGLLHGLGKLLAHPAWGTEPQWAVCGESFPVGCAHSPLIACPQGFSVNPDRRRRMYNTPVGMYKKHCGLRSVYMSWSAAEYVHMVLQRNHTALPPEALFVLRFQKAHALTRGAYAELMDDYDAAMMPWLAAFQELAVYRRMELPGRLWGAELHDYYNRLLMKYRIGVLRW